MAPPVPLFTGSSVVVREQDGILRFSDPRGAFGLSLPSERLVHAFADESWDGATAELRFFGEFSRVAQPEHVRLGPLVDAEAVALCELLKARLDLPRLPVVCTADELAALGPRVAYVVASGQYRVSCERPNFGSARLCGRVVYELEQRGMEEGGTYQVVGFYIPAPREPVAGYGGPCIEVLAIEPAERSDSA
jgi:hypothetical protein